MPKPKTVTMIPVRSSTIKAVGHDGTDLHVQFVNGGGYVYRNVPAKLFGQLLKAPSLGSFFHRNIKNKHKFEKVS